MKNIPNTRFIAVSLGLPSRYLRLIALRPDIDLRWAPSFYRLINFSPGL
jgi:hypothetical protein